VHRLVKTHVGRDGNGIASVLEPGMMPPPPRMPPDLANAMDFFLGLAEDQPPPPPESTGFNRESIDNIEVGKTCRSLPPQRVFT
jgi:hypothetical protein